jgi:acyl carrier protein|tara:strand:- start:380 stop:622 length:243 start_codon:yes stop_codon:yes gene_type:complete
MIIMEEIEQRIIRIVADQLCSSPDQVSINDSFMDDLDADSLNAVEIIMAVEEEFNEEIPDEDSENFVTVGHLVEYIKKRL